MKYCPSCGAVLEDNMMFCSSCGAQQSAQQPVQQQPYHAQQPYQGQQPYQAQQPSQAQQPYQEQQPYQGQQPYQAQQPYQGQQPYQAQQPYQGQQPYQAQQAGGYIYPSVDVPTGPMPNPSVYLVLVILGFVLGIIWGVLSVSPYKKMKEAIAANNSYVANANAKKIRTFFIIGVIVNVLFFIGGIARI